MLRQRSRELETECRPKRFQQQEQTNKRYIVPEEDNPKVQCWRPFPSQDIEADPPNFVDVGVVDFGEKTDLQQFQGCAMKDYV